MALRPEAPSWEPVGDEANASNNSNSNANSNNNNASSKAQQQSAAKGSGGGPTTEAKLFVGQIPYEANAERLGEIFGAYGRVRAIHILQDGSGPGGRGGGGGGGRGGSAHSSSKGRAAFITYESTDEADTAIFTLHNRYRMLTNRPLQVSYAKNSPNISAFGRAAAIEVANANQSNPMPC